MLANWGKITSKHVFFEGCVNLCCEYHGGIVVESNVFESHPLFVAFKSLAKYFRKNFYDNGAYYFEEDCETSIIIAVLPQSVLAKLNPSFLDIGKFQAVLNSSYRTLLKYYPEVFTVLTGKEVGIFESGHYFDTLLISQESKLFYATKITGYNVPNGFVAARISLGRTGFSKSIPKGCYLFSIEEFKAAQGARDFNGVTLPFDGSYLDQAKPFTVDLSLPYIRPEVIDPTSYYFCKVDIHESGHIVIAYNYEKEDKRSFLFQDMYWFEFISNKYICEIKIDPETNLPLDKKIKPHSI